VGEGGNEDPEKKAKFDAGIAAVQALPEQSEEEFSQSLGKIKGDYGFDELKPNNEGEDWKIHAVMRQVKDINKRKMRRDQIILTRPKKFRPSTLDKLSEEYSEDHDRRYASGRRLRAYRARRHIMAVQELIDHYHQVLNDNSISYTDALSLLRATLSKIEITCSAKSWKTIQRDAQKAVNKFFNDHENIMVGDSSENSSIGKNRDKPDNWSKGIMDEHISAMKSYYFLK
jgi:hypothetical protein